MTKQSITKALATAAAGATLLALTVTAPAHALAPENPFNADAQPTWQTNGTVWALASARGKVFAGGSFTQVRAPGTAVGHTSTQNWSSLVVLDAATGTPVTSCTVNVTLGTSSGSVRSLAASPDGSTIYLGGSFGAVNGTPRSNVAAINADTCALLPFNPGANSFVYAIAPTADSVYFGGKFTAFGSQARTRLAATTPAGALLPWAPNVEDEILALGVEPVTGNVVLGGRMDLVNGRDSHDLAVVDGNTGTTNVKEYPQPFFPYSAGDGQRAGNSAIKAITTDATGFYIGAEGSGFEIFDGRAAFDWGTYAQRWRDNCLGATQALAVHKSVLFIGNHAHDCKSEGMFEDGQRRYLNAQRTDNKKFVPWWPNTNGGSGEALGPRAITVAASGTANYLWYGGEFTTVNGVSQQSLTRFSEGTDTGAPSKPQTPNLTSTKSGEVRVMIRTTQDNDDTTLTYNVFRGTGTTPINPTPLTADSLFYDHPQLVFTETGLTPGSTQSYRVQATDGKNNSQYSDVRTITVAGTSNAYANKVADDGASEYFRMEEASGTAAGNNGSSTQAGSYVDTSQTATSTSVASRSGQPSGLAKYPGTSALFNGSTHFLRTDSRAQAPSVYSLELWFKTSTTAGGRLIGYSNKALTNGYSTSPNSTFNQHDRHIYLSPTGKLVFGTQNGSTLSTLTSAASYNDNAWHHVVATQGSTGMTLYADGQQLASNGVKTALGINGYWRIGGDAMGSNWPNKPTTGYYAGNIDEAAVYPSVLTAAQVADHYTLASGNTAPRTVSVPASEDAQVKQASPSSNYGNGATLWADTQDIAGNNSSRVQDHLKFDVPALAAGESITGARLSLNVTNSTPDGPSVYRTASTWSESTLTWASGRPARSSTTADGNFGNLPLGRTSTPVTGVTAGSDVSFELSPDSTDGVLFSSSEDTTAANRPQLILTIASDGGSGGSDGGTSDTTAPPAPSVSPDSGTYSSAQSVTMSNAEAGAVIRYTVASGTTPPTDPTGSSPTYSGPISVEESSVIKARAYDAAGNASPIVQRDYVITDAVEPITRTVTLNPTADTQVKQASPTANYGGGATLWADSEDITGNTSSRVQDYLKFDVPTLAEGESITGARLSLNVTNSTGNGPAIYRTETTWDEATMTWNSGRPARSSNTAVGNYGSMPVSRLSTTVTGITAAGEVSFELAPESTDGVLVSSSEDTTQSRQPELIITISR